MSHADGGHDAPRPIVRLDRYVLVVTPRDAWVAWARRIEEEDGLAEGEAPITLEDAQINFQSTFLVPYTEEAEDVVAWVADNVDVVFEQMLHDFADDPARWPADRSAEVFDSWFELDLLDAPIDLVDAPLVVDEDEEPGGAGDTATAQPPHRQPGSR